MLERIVNGIARAVMTPVRLALTPFTFAFNLGKTAVSTLTKFASGEVGDGFKELVKGTGSAALKAGVNLVGNANPITAFTTGAVMKNGFKLD